MSESSKAFDALKEEEAGIQMWIAELAEAIAPGTKNLEQIRTAALIVAHKCDKILMLRHVALEALCFDDDDDIDDEEVDGNVQ